MHGLRHNVNDFLTQAPTLLLQTCVHTRKEPRKPSLSSGNRCRTVHSCDDVLTHEHCGGAATMLKSSDTKQLSRASRAVTPEGCSDVEASHHQPARAHGSSAGRSAHFWRRGRAAGAERSWKAAPAWCGNVREISTPRFSHCDAHAYTEHSTLYRSNCMRNDKAQACTVRHTTCWFMPPWSIHQSP